MNEYTIRVAKREDIAVLFEWAEDLHWKIGIGDLEMYFDMDPESFLVGEIQGKVISSVMGFRYTDSYAFIGYYAVVEQHRGKGYGLKLFRALQERLRATKTVSLLTLSDGIATYRNSGFTEEGHQTTRYMGYGTKGSPLPAVPEGTGELIPIANCSSSAKAEIARWDTEAEAYCVPREALLLRLLSRPEIQGWVVRSTASANEGDIVGYGLFRRAKGVCKFGPLVARSSSVAVCILSALRTLAEPGEAFYIDVSSLSLAAREVMKSAGLTALVDLTLLCNVRPPSFNTSLVYGQYSLEIG